MSPENCKRVQAAVKEAGDHLKDRLPPHLGLAKRNPYAHLWERIKSTKGMSYKECDDSDVEEVLAIVEHYRNNPC